LKRAAIAARDLFESVFSSVKPVTFGPDGFG